MLRELLQATIIVSVMAATLRIATPLLLAALGELVTERSGVLNLGVEGTMLMGAFAGFLVTNQTGSLWLGVLAAILTGGLMALFMVFLASTLKVDQIVTGMALNLFASGMSLFLFKSIYADQENFPTIKMFEPLEIPLLSRIPYLGEALFSQRLLTYIALLMVPAIWVFLYRTRFGLQIRCLGENPRAIDMKGVSVSRLQYLATIFGGMMGGLAGTFLTLGTTTRFIPEISAGRGWLAIVIVIAGNWMPWRILVASLIFAFLDALQLQIQGIGIQIPYQILLALPYVFAIVAIMGSRARSRAPNSLGVPYVRE
jgi:simple sugar transport system permease protein